MSNKKKSISLSYVMTGMVTLIVLLVSCVILGAFIHIYRSSIEQNALTSSEQSVMQAYNTILNYTADMQKIMEMIQQNVSSEKSMENEFFQDLLRIRTDVVAVTIYDSSGAMKSGWTGDYRLKNKILENLSYMKISNQYSNLHFSNPHVESLFADQYPWVVTMSQNMVDGSGKRIQVALDFRFSKIANYLDGVGIGQHGYCFLMSENGEILYHPQQQLIFAGLKEENTDQIRLFAEGSYLTENAIYTVKTLDDTGWKLVGVSYVDELITSRVISAVRIVALISLIVLAAALISGMVLSRVFARPVRKLTKAMRDFEKDAQKFSFEKIHGTSEIAGLSDSFDHMVRRIQQLMEKVREEDVILRKTELNALQSQINPHFLYNTLDSIAWMCEEERTSEAVEMVNALARLFRISISKGYELITIDKELQHAQCYLQIQKYRYKDQFAFYFDVQDCCRNYLCNKITLQPIIENAIVHGLDMSEHGEIRISVREEGDDIVLCVKDNGIGMNPQQCREILQQDTKERTGIGLKNVNDRIKIYFGERYGCTIESEQDIGTSVSIRIPRIEEADYEQKA